MTFFQLVEALSQVRGIRVLHPRDHAALAGCDRDPLRLVIDVSGTGHTGFEAESRLCEEFQIIPEFSDARNLVFVLGPGDSPAVYTRLEQAMRSLSNGSGKHARAGRPVTQSAPLPDMALTPREAAFRPRTSVPLRSAAGRISGEVITMYPPGIPVICPGETFSPEVVDYCEYLVRQRVCIYGQDRSLATVQVL